MIEVITPAGFERFFREFVDMADGDRPIWLKWPNSPPDTNCHSPGLSGCPT